eukprot:UN00750
MANASELIKSLSKEKCKWVREPILGKESALIVIDMANYNCKVGHGLYKQFTEKTLKSELKYYFDSLNNTVIPNVKELLDTYRKINGTFYLHV